MSKIPTFEEFLEKENIKIKSTEEFEKLKEKLRDVKNTNIHFGKTKINCALNYYQVSKSLITMNVITEEQAEDVWKEMVNRNDYL